ncbi:hypothetical protein QAD02_011693 [Eretmocerus hayati]|uniref:Uncharacterized protein n=1 Tax=Eretmocerus hayati TaxID=131215 RepID=A0ACC2NXR0_9HYME|nr:hypothetical protein QAD02_011693 [Eretmocerus hayati]
MPTRRASAFYAFNVPTEGIMNGALDQSLEIRTILIAPNSHSTINEMPGINTEFLYFDGAGSLSECHKEDHDLASVNVVYFNLPPNSQDLISKIWLIIIYVEKLYEVLHDIFGEHSAECSEKMSAVRAGSSTGQKCIGCPFPLDHKDLHLTPNFCDEHGITYNIVQQKLDDVLYLCCGAIHQVTQVTSNCAGAINFADKFWAALAASEGHCHSSDSRMTLVPIPDNLHLSMDVERPKLHHCLEDNCTWFTLDKSPLVFHAKVSTALSYLHGHRKPTNIASFARRM